ncbi:endonuclease/exonuclease/phosphatase family metal-dependent hydrolase [Dysgonomonas hofstadii]|uniref:Endonuclease/exonuclease/phosphatase family metal-dependent hydrolase n=2 Tax=Dysgonomonas hofstadii TaxID=637886 RepID=A0A840CZD0_9BACT|nr:endonuclease/exonuclease/phosphatase family metal-dependent hydrolase [Dysgonomonas hofstadii]
MMKKSVFTLVFVFFSIYIANAQDLVVGTYNVRNDNQGDAEKGNGWEQRCPVISQLILFNDFDLVGTQEVKHNQLEDLLRELPQYSHVGVGRDDGETKGEYAPIFYKKDRFELLKSGNFWLAEETGYPNKGWDAALPRICSWGYFKDRKKKKKIWFFNLHMDHVGVEARRQSARLVLDKTKEMCGKDAVILTGDFNVDQTHKSYELLATSGILADSYEKARTRYALNGTFNAFKSNLMTNSRIDHVFVSDKFSVDRYGVLTDSYRTPKKDSKEIHVGDFPKEVFSVDSENRLPSDHFPVKVILSYNK